MKFIPNAVSRAVSGTVLKTQKNSPTILFGAGVVGVIGSAVLACKATLKVEEVLAEAEDKLNTVKTIQHKDYSEEDRQKDKLLIYVQTAVRLTKLYAPAIIVGSLSIVSLASSHKILKQRNAAITAAYVVMEQAFEEYRQRVREELGDERDQHFRYGSETRQVVTEGKNGPEVEDMITVETKKVPGGYSRFFDEYSTLWDPRAEINLLTLRAQQLYLNDLLQARGHVFLNEVYDKLGLDRTSAGQAVGWVLGEGRQNFIDFGVFNGENPKARDFVNGREGAILLDFNVDGVIYNLI